MNKKTSILIHLIVPLFALHLLEEIKTGFYQTDSSIKYLSKYITLTPEITFLLIEILLFLFLGFLLFIILSKKKIPFFLLLILGIILIYEFSHIYEAIELGAYSSGVVTGTLIGTIGIIFFCRLLKKSY